MPVELSYLGEKDLSEAMSLKVERGDTALDARLRIAEVIDWVDAAPGSPLPPMVGTLKTPKLVFDGVELEGVEIEVKADEPVEVPDVPLDGDATVRKSASAAKPAGGSVQAPVGAP